MAKLDNDKDWLAVIARALGFLCIQSSQLKDRTIAQKALFLDSIGLDRVEIASMLDSTSASIAELIRQARVAKKGSKKNAQARKKSIKK